MPITTDEDIKTYLTSQKFPFETVEELTGGTGNFVWRVRDKSGSSKVVKHAEPYVRTNAQVKFSVERMGYEAQLMQKIPDVLLQGVKVLVPHIFKYDSENSVLIMADAGEKTLKAAYGDPNVDVSALGESIGKWLRELHRSTLDLDIGEGGNPTGRAIYRYIYYNLHTVFEANGYDTALAHQVNDEFGSLLATDDYCVCHGDFWPGNFLLTPSEADPVPPVTVVDWELTRRGFPATDVAQFAAESWLLERFRKGKPILKPFLQAYVSAGPELVDENFIRRAAVHWGCHIAFWGSQTGWTSDAAENKELVRTGREMIQWALSSDWENIKKSPLGPLFKS